MSGTSILRELEYEKLATLSFKGHTLDFGGGKKADYLLRLNIEGTLESLNISEKMEPTFIADANQTLRNQRPVAYSAHAQVVLYHLLAREGQKV